MSGSLFFHHYEQWTDGTFPSVALGLLNAESLTENLSILGEDFMMQNTVSLPKNVYQLEQHLMDPLPGNFALKDI